MFQKGKINLILGPTGSGKTSLLLALLGELHFSPPGPDSWYNLPRDKGVAYAAQEPWVQNETIRVRSTLLHCCYFAYTRLLGQHLVRQGVRCRAIQKRLRS